MTDINPDLKKIGIALAIAPLLITLFIKAQAPDPIRHHRTLTALNKMERLNSEIEILTLKLRYRLQNNYDGLVFAVKEIEQIQNELKFGDHSIFQRGNARVDRAIVELEQVMNRKAELVDRFKSHNAVLKNSLYYFPQITEEAISEARNNKKLHENLQSLMHNVLMVHMGSGDSGNAEVNIRSIENSPIPPALKYF